MNPDNNLPKNKPRGCRKSLLGCATKTSVIIGLLLGLGLIFSPSARWVFSEIIFGGKMLPGPPMSHEEKQVASQWHSLDVFLTQALPDYKKYTWRDGVRTFLIQSRKTGGPLSSWTPFVITIFSATPEEQKKIISGLQLKSRELGIRRMRIEFYEKMEVTGKGSGEKREAKNLQRIEIISN